MKKIFLTVFILTIFILTGCSGKETNTSSIPNKQNTITVTIGEETFSLNYERNLNKMYYKENYIDFRTDSIGNMHIIQYRKNDEFIFETRLIYDGEHSFEENKNKINESSVLKRINDIDYTYFDYKNDNKDTVHVYMYNYNDVTYAISFTSSIDISDFETTFMNNVYFK